MCVVEFVIGRGEQGDDRAGVAAGWAVDPRVVSGKKTMLYKMCSMRVNKERAVAACFVGFGFRPSSRRAGFHPGEAVMVMGWDILFVQQQWPVARTQRQGFLERRKLGKYH